MVKLSKKEQFRLEKEREKKRKNSIKISIAFVIIIFLAFLVKLNNDSNNETLIYGDDVIEMNFFHLSTCPHCIEQKKFHKTLMKLYPELKINSYELTESGSKEKFEELSTAFDNLDFNKISTPTTIIGDEINVGFGTPETTGQKLIEMIEKEKERIEENWNNETMVRTIDLRGNSNEEN